MTHAGTERGTERGTFTRRDPEDERDLARFAASPAPAGVPQIPAALARYLEALPQRPEPGYSLWRDARGQVQGRFHHCSLTSAFAPVIELADRRAIGHEGTIRTYAGEQPGLAAWKLFALAADDASLVALDRLSRLLHAINYVAAGGTGRLVLNVHNRLLVAVADDHGAAFRRAVQALDLPQSQLVIQVPASANDNLPLLLQVVGNYRRNGFAVSLQASDPAEAGVLIAQARPDWLKLDMGRLWTDRQLAGLRASAADAGVTLIGRRLDSAETALRLQAAGIELGQGTHAGATLGPGELRRAGPLSCRPDSQRPDPHRRDLRHPDLRHPDSRRPDSRRPDSHHDDQEEPR
ncbi:EAL domain-containing protein [Cupriavidus gilardii]|uniref:EAL domain-containing protein n=1 Tax=Cupriavidus gilardii TaxID=82541 RepID=A0ABY4VSM5_9BURK|nr:EAL domain-containing protein [Cupriavidus gilardii]USE78786.1 EAL domain-containing protein [Cupriavidus gilardii]